MENQLNEEEVSREVLFKATRSSGKGGQHVNKVATRVEAYLDIAEASCFSPEQKEILLEKLAGKLSQAGLLQVNSEEGRSQLMNKERALKKMLALLEKALKPRKPRKKTRPGRAAIEKRLREKTLLSRKKEVRRKPSERNSE